MTTASAGSSFALNFTLLVPNSSLDQSPLSDWFDDGVMSGLTMGLVGRSVVSILRGS